MIRSRGYSGVQQIHYSRNPLRQIWRRVRKNSWLGWKTFWKASSPNGQPVFVKVSFGHDTLPDDQRTVDAENEVLLHDYLRPLIQPLAQVQMLDPVDHWGSRDTYFIVYPWNAMRNLDLCDALRRESIAGSMAGILRALYGLPPPPGWSRFRETHNHACSNYDSPDHAHASPFDVDFVHNISLSENGRFVFYDLEKYQWAPLGLQEVVLLQYLWALAKKTKAAPDKNLFAIMAGHVPPPVRAGVFRQGWRILQVRASAWNLPLLDAADVQRAEQFILNV